MRYINIPLRARTFAPIHDLARVEDNEGNTYTDTIPTEFAVEIIQACNSFDDLLAACKLAKEHLDAMRQGKDLGRLSFDQVEQALIEAIEKAEGE